MYCIPGKSPSCNVQSLFMAPSMRIRLVIGKSGLISCSTGPTFRAELPSLSYICQIFLGHMCAGAPAMQLNLAARRPIVLQVIRSYAMWELQKLVTEPSIECKGFLFCSLVITRMFICRLQHHAVPCVHLQCSDGSSRKVLCCFLCQVAHISIFSIFRNLFEALRSLGLFVCVAALECAVTNMLMYSWYSENVEEVECCSGRVELAGHLPWLLHLLLLTACGEPGVRIATDTSAGSSHASACEDDSAVTQRSAGTYHAIGVPSPAHPDLSADHASTGGLEWTHGNGNSRRDSAAFSVHSTSEPFSGVESEVCCVSAHAAIHGVLACS